MFESLEPQVTRPSDNSVVQDGRAPGQDASPPEPDDARVKAAVFSEPTCETQPPSLLGFAAAGMLLHDLLQDSAKRSLDEDEEEQKNTPPQPTKPTP